MRNFKCDNFFGMIFVERMMSLIQRNFKSLNAQGQANNGLKRSTVLCSVAPIQVGARIMIKFNPIGTY